MILTWHSKSNLMATAVARSIGLSLLFAKTGLTSKSRFIQIYSLQSQVPSVLFCSAQQSVFSRADCTGLVISFTSMEDGSSHFFILHNAAANEK